MIKRTLIEVIGLLATADILKMVNEKGKTNYMDLKPLASYSTLNKRLLQLVNLGLLKHNIVRDKERREEWYEITEKGKKVLRILEQLQNVAEE